jgi:hypothetical protein
MLVVVFSVGEIPIYVFIQIDVGGKIANNGSANQGNIYSYSVTTYFTAYGNIYPLVTTYSFPGSNAFDGVVATASGCYGRINIMGSI